MQKPVQEKWAALGGFTPHKEVLQSDTFKKATPFNEASPQVSHTSAISGQCRNTLELLEVCQTNWSEAISKIKTPKEALDTISRKHEEIFEDAGYYDE